MSSKPAIYCQGFCEECGNECAYMQKDEYKAAADDLAERLKLAEETAGKNAQTGLKATADIALLAGVVKETADAGRFILVGTPPRYDEMIRFQRAMQALFEEAMKLGMPRARLT